ncbi:MAG: hypothetical protein JJU13_16365 [Balneolaceae bacterium]|nr:hypothetical protein [Balneolaceae bacterium]
MKQIPAPRDFAGALWLAKAILNHSRTVKLLSFYTTIVKELPNPYTPCGQDEGGRFIEV